MNMREVQNIIIGFGKAGKTLAGYLAKKGEKTVLIEENPLRYGGTEERIWKRYRGPVWRSLTAEPLSWIGSLTVK